MATLNIDQLCEDLEALVGKAKYPTSGSGSTNYNQIMNGAAVDCSGLLVAAFKKQSVSLYHGSNTIWRTYLSDKGTVTDNTSSNGYKKLRASENPLKASQLKKGMAVFKWNSATPSKFNDGEGDYQHIGVVTSVSPLHIVHSTSVNNCGVTMDTKIGTFCAWGWFKAAPAMEEDDEETTEVSE